MDIVRIGGGTTGLLVAFTQSFLASITGRFRSRNLDYLFYLQTSEILEINGELNEPK